MTMKVGDNQISFKWRNYAAPTPRNLLYWSGVMRDAVTFITTFSIIMEAHWVVPVAIQLTGFFLDKAKNFFAMVDDDVKTESVQAEFPSGDQVTITKTTPEDEPK